VALIFARISSPDFIDQLLNNEFGYRFKVELFSSILQGDDASQSMIEALLEINRQIDDFDVVAIIRGGGAATDLDCFDSYDLATHVAQFPIPIITGIGHERDETIVDMVAHSKMKTPTAVAEFLVFGLNAFEGKVESLFDMVDRYAMEVISERTLKLESVAERIKGLYFLQFEIFYNRLGKLADNLNYASKLMINE